MLASSFFSLSLLWFMLFLGTGGVDGAAVIAKSITVAQTGHGNFRTIQAAINSVPDWNKQWIRIHVKRGIYREKIIIPTAKEYILLEGEGSGYTKIEWADHSDQTAPDSINLELSDTMNSATFSVFAANFVAKSIEFTNTYNLGKGNQMLRAVAALIGGDKSAFYDCSFRSVQDTLCDYTGRHYFKRCRIEGVMDFIFGYGQSIYEHCNIVTLRHDQLPRGCITAQGRGDPNQPGGFVFKYSSVFGYGKIFLGRAWGKFSTVVFYATSMSDAVAPEGWDAWHYVGHENQITYTEDGNRGPGANLSKRVKWMKKLKREELGKFVSMEFIDSEGWLSKQP